MRAGLLFTIVTLTLVATSGCGRSSPPAERAGSPPKAGPVKITQFYSDSKMIPRGLKANICYGVENAVKLELTPPVETLWPSAVRCFEVSPTVKTTYTLTAYGEDGSRETKSIEQTVGAPPPRLYDLWVNSVDVRRGSEVKICFKVDNVKSVKVSPGKLDGTGRCMTDRPSKTTTYKIVAMGGDREIDNGTVTVKVH
ncbi:MAG: hypothetical protein M3N54_13620 [Acidobacteriota bacterium]|nr:hypothetical protein [Acidobacteriota bacterium]